MQELLFLGLFMVALAVGWYLGRREAIKVRFLVEPHGSAIDRQYFIGLNYLLNEQPDEAIETFIRALEVNPETVETHIAIGRLFCQRGDVERAIKVHQNLLARPNLTREQADRVQYELARDFLAVGMHQRAERLLDELINSRSPMRAEALVDLVKIHERERDWEQAVEVGRKLAIERPAFAGTLAHYHCELALIAQRERDWQQARMHLRNALSADSSNVRAILMFAELEEQQGDHQECVARLKQLAETDPDFVPQALPLARRCADNGALNLSSYLERIIGQAKNSPIAIVMERAEEIKKHSGIASASRYMVAQLQAAPSLRGLLYLMNLNAGAVEPSGQGDQAALRGIIEALVADAHQYRCQACGFSTRRLHWQCPTCHGWSTVRPLKGHKAP
ncbi:lipopolysaccharide assembly protein LapB [Pseudomonas sp. gcc21]|uniref:lipopolysaccharide assembly protein LapB n=1 Tax=Pseudomonas sp. gcc21 TaxID=2726989 RepID=UPI001451B6D2|nr:lipopolysaccharide assembly protein LapB [Pseudomonas sp. gcc21]QJD57763.1 lipopolysaccharide assembly protein LapB [Pseudomonas sp. gcc21]